MATAPRPHLPGTTYHVRLKAVRGSPLFADDQDREVFLSLCSKYLTPDKALVITWTLIPNHGHIQIREGETSLSSVMHRLNTHYAVYYNRRHGPNGHVFKDRYWRKEVSTEGYFRKLHGYINGNPVHAGLVTLQQLAEYPWGGYGALVGRQAPRPFHSTEEALRLIDPDPVAARRAVLDWTTVDVQEHLAQEAARAQDLIAFLEGSVCSRWGVGAAELRSARTGEGAAARRELIVAARAQGMSVSEIARRLGLNRGSVWRMSP